MTIAIAQKRLFNNSLKKPINIIVPRINRLLMRCFSAVILLLLAVSCSKNAANVNVSYNSLYYKDKVQAIGSTRLFARSGEIKDAAAINRYAGTDSNYYKYFPDRISGLGELLDTLIIKNRDSAIIELYSSPNRCLVTNQAGKLVLTSVQSATGVQFYETFSRSFNYYANQFKPVISNEYLVSSTGGIYEFDYVYYPKYVFTQAGNGRVAAPLVAFFQHKSNGENYAGYFNGNLQQGFNQQIPAGDTVSLNEFQLIFNN